MAIQTIAGVAFQPWVGTNYQTASPRLLIVGQSHYDWLGRKLPVSSVTTAVIGCAIEYGSGPLFTNLVATCTGEWPDAEARKHFWESVAYYNYIQEFVGDGPRKPHPYELWVKSHDSFAAVLGALKPELILVFGITNWNNIANLSGTKGEPLTVGPQRYNETWLYPVGQHGTAVAFHIKHPSAGFNYKTFMPLFAEVRQRCLRSQPRQKAF